MKRLSLWLLSMVYTLALTAQNETSIASFFEKADVFFQDYAAHNSIRYQALYHNPTSLSELLDQIKEIETTTLSPQEAKAFYINTYNLLVIKTVVQHYPIASPQEVVDFWDEIQHSIGGKAYTLEGLEAYIWKQYQDPLLHFVLCKGAVGGAPIANFAYHPKLLSTQLKQRAIAVLNNPQWVAYNSLNQTLVLPNLFRQYRADFGPELLSFINLYRVDKIAEVAHLTYSNEDWQLNSYHAPPEFLTKKQAKKADRRTSKNEYSSLSQVITLSKGVAEFTNFNSLYTAGIGSRESGSRNTYFNSYFTAYYGVTGKLDIGINVLFRASRERDPFTTSPFQALTFERTPKLNGQAVARNSYYADWGLTHLGVQARYAPFKNLNLSIEHGVLLPIQNLPYENTVDQSVYAITQLYYIHALSSKTQLFFALTYWQPIKINETFRFQPPLLRCFFNYFATPRFSLYATSMYLVEWGVGARYMLTPKFEVQAMCSYYIPIPGLYDLLAPGAREIHTYNIGFRYRL